MCENPMCHKENCDIVYGFCHCNCEKETSICCNNDKFSGRIRGVPFLYCKGHRNTYIIPFVINLDTGCWDWQKSKVKGGYGRVYNKGKSVPAHKFYYEEKFGEIPENYEMHHKCGNPGCVNPDHLEAITHTENIRHRNFTKLSMEKAKEIREMYSTGNYLQREIAVLYGVCRQTVNYLIQDKTWRE